MDQAAETEDNSMIKITNIFKTYTMGENVVKALNDVSLVIEDGEFLAIMGPSGSGKSTLTHIIGLLDVPNAGSYQLNGREVSQLSEDELAVLRREEIGFIFQQFNLLPRMTAVENVGLPLLYSKKIFAQNFTSSLLEKMGLALRLDHRPNALSGGQQQRVAIARALVNKPKMILADEPTGNLDSASSKEVMAILHELNSQGITIVIVTHEEEIGQQAKRLIRMRDGVVQSDVRKIPAEISDFKKIPELPNTTVISVGSWAEIVEHFKQGFKALIANKVRTCLSMLGISIGVAAVIAMLAIGNGAQKAIESQMAALGSNLFVLRTGATRVGGVVQDSGVSTRLTHEDSEALKEQIPAVKETSTRVNGKGEVTYLGQNWHTQVLGVDSSYARMHASQPEIGRYFTDEDNKKRARVVVLGSTVAKELFANNSPIGETVRINKIGFLVIGVMPEKGTNGWQDQDDVVAIPVLTFMHRLHGRAFVDAIEIEVNDANNMPEVEEAALEIMYKRKKVPPSVRHDAFVLRNMADIKAAMSESNETMATLLAVIAAISLLVGGIGIMNIMLVSVSERTKEIGLRKAVGARKKDIQMQFLVESIVVSAIGGIAGIVLGGMITTILSMTIGWATSISLTSVLLSFSFSAAIGMIFGIYPAKKASKLNPIDALRFE